MYNTISQDCQGGKDGTIPISSTNLLCGVTCVHEQGVSQRIGDRLGDLSRAVRIGVAVVFQAIVGIERHVDVGKMRLLHNAPPQLALLREIQSRRATTPPPN